MLIVMDTNVLVSALITPFGNAARILDMVLLGDLQILYDDRILSEYSEVLQREKFGFDGNDIDDLLSFIDAEGIRATSTPLDYPVIDKNDIPFIEVAVSGTAAALITGNKRHFKGVNTKKIKIMNPDEFLKFWQKERKL